MRVNALVSMILATTWVAASSMALAQNATSPAPAREAPRPQDLEPRVDTSATPARETQGRETPTRETPRPEDLEPRVNTSAPSSSSSAPTGANEAAPGATSGPGGGAAASATTRESRPSTASGAPATGASAPTAAVGATAAGNPQGTAAKPAAKGKALDRLELDTTQITGNRELPKVLYIVPWKRSDLGDLVGKPVNSLLDEVLTPVDRDVFQRENRYYRALTPGAVENDALSAPDSRAPTPTRNPVPTNSAPAAGMPGSATHPTNASAAGGATGSGSAAPPKRDEK
jgi:hypothetical protein